MNKIDLGSKKIGVSKYITEIKELPPVHEQEKDSVNSDSNEGDKIENEKPSKNFDETLKTADFKSNEHDRLDSTPSKGDASVLEEAEDLDGKRKLPFASKDIILGAINLVTVIFLIVITYRFPVKSTELKNLRSENSRNESNITFEFTDIENSKERGQRLNKLFLDESGIVDFVNEVEKIKTKNRALNKVSFTRQKGVKDRSSNFGIPVVIELRGIQSLVEEDLTDLQSLPFLFRPVSVEIGRDTEDPLVLNFKYGGILYVIDRLGEDR